MLREKKQILEKIKSLAVEYDSFQISFRNNDKDFNFNYTDGSIDFLMNILLALPDEGEIVISKISYEVSIDKEHIPMTRIIEIIKFSFIPELENKNEMETISSLEKFMTRQLDWYIEQSQKNEERLDRRLKEIMKSANVSNEIDAQKIDFSSLLPHIMPIIETLKGLGK